MQKNDATGAVRATRFFMFLSIAALFSLLVSGPAVGAQQPADGPTIKLGDVEVSGPICGDSTQMIIPFDAAAPLGIARIDISASAEGVTASYEDSIIFDSPTQTYSDAPIFEVPADTPTSTWTVVVRIFANEQVSADETTVEVEADPNCSDSGAQPAVALDAITVSGPVCPSAATVSISYTATVTTERGYVDVVAVPKGLNGYGPLKKSEEIIGAAGEPASITSVIELDADTPTSTWDVVVSAGDGGVSDLASAEGSFEVVANPGCATSVAVKSATVCPDEGKLTVSTEVTGGKGTATLGVQAQSPQGESVVFPDKQLTLSADAQTVSATIDVPKTSTAGLWNMGLVLEKGNRMISVDYYDPGFQVDVKCGANLGSTPGPTAGSTPQVTPSPTSGGGGGTNVVTTTPTPSVGATAAPTASGTPATSTPTTAPKATATPTGKGNSNLAFTGSNTSVAVTVGVVLIAVGLLVAFVASQRRARD